MAQIKDLEDEIEERNQASQTELSEAAMSSEESLQQLKNFYEIEKERLEQRLKDEKSKSLNQMNSQNDDYETKIQEDSSQHDEDIQILQEEMQEKDLQF